MKSTDFWVFEDLKFKISEGYDPNWCFPDSAQLATGDYCIEFWIKFGNSDHSVLVRKKRGLGGKHLDTK